MGIANNSIMFSSELPAKITLTLTNSHAEFISQLKLLDHNWRLLQIMQYYWNCSASSNNFWEYCYK